MHNKIFCLSDKDYKLVMSSIKETRCSEFSLRYMEDTLSATMDFIVPDERYEFLYDEWRNVPHVFSEEKLLVFGKTINLILPDKLVAKCLELTAKQTEAEVNADCEPSGIDILLIISKSEVKLYCCGRVIHHESDNNPLSSDQYFISK